MPETNIKALERRLMEAYPLHYSVPLDFKTAPHIVDMKNPGLVFASIPNKHEGTRLFLFLNSYGMSQFISWYKSLQ